MKARRSHNLPLFPWLSLPAVLIGHLALWGRMPADVAVHLTPSGRPVTLMSPAGFLLLSVALLLGVLVAFTWRLRGVKDGDASRLLLRYYFTVAAMVVIDFGLLAYNVIGQA